MLKTGFLWLLAFLLGSGFGFFVGTSRSSLDSIESTSGDSPQAIAWQNHSGIENSMVEKIAYNQGPSDQKLELIDQMIEKRIKADIYPKLNELKRVIEQQRFLLSSEEKPTDPLQSQAQSIQVAELLERISSQGSFSRETQASLVEQTKDLSEAQKNQLRVLLADQINRGLIQLDEAVIFPIF